MPVIKGTLFYPCLNKKNKLSDTYEVKVGKLDKKTIDLLSDMDIEIIEGEGKTAEFGRYINMKSEFPIKVVDSKGKEVPESLVNRIGSGTLAKIGFQPYNWKYKNKKGVSAGAREVMILRLVEYTSASKLEPEEDGFVVGEDSFIASKEKTTKAHLNDDIDEDFISDGDGDDEEFIEEEEDAA